MFIMFIDTKTSSQWAWLHIISGILCVDTLYSQTCLKHRQFFFCLFLHEANSPGEDFIKGMVIGILLVVEDVKEPLPVSYNDVAIVIEEKIVMRHLGDVPNAFVNLMGLLYMLNLDYPKEMKYTFEVIQRLFMGIGSEMCTSRVHSLKNKLLS